MAKLNDNFTLRAPVPVDDKLGWWDEAAGAWKPFASRQDAIDKTPHYRFRTMTLPVEENGDVVEYWFKMGVQDEDLVLKTSQADLSNYYTKNELQTSGQAQVNWDNLINIPALSVTWENITGDQSVIGNAGFTNTANYITSADLPPIQSPLTFENGLREDGGVVKLGLDLTTIGTTNKGLLTEDTYLFRQGSDVSVVGLLDGLLSIVARDTTSTNISQVDLTKDIINIQRTVGGNIKSFTISSAGFFIHDNDAVGLGDAGDYSANKTAYSYVTKMMLDAVEAQIPVVVPQVNSDWNATSGLAQILNKPSLATVATTGDYNDLINQPSIPDLSGYATESWVISQGYLTSVSSSWDINTGDLTIQGNNHNLDGRYMLRSNTITSGYGITASGDFTNPVNIEVDTTTLDNRYLRKDVNDSNGSFNLTLGTLDVGDTSIDGTLNISSIATGLITDDLLIRDAATGDIKSIPMPSFGGAFNIANNTGVTQFSVDSGDSLRINATGDASVSFNAGTKTITINSSGGSTGGGVDSWNARTGHVVPESGDYTTTLVTEGTNQYFTQARVRATPLTGFSATNSAIVATDNVLQALGKAQGQINNLVPTTRTLTVNGTAGNITVSGGTQNLGSNASWTVNLATVGTAGANKTKVTTDAYGRVVGSAALTIADLPSEVTQSLSFNTTTSILSLSNSNDTPIYSLRPITRQDALERYNQSVFTPFTTSAGHTGYVGGTEFGTGIRIERRSGDTSQTGWQIYKRANVNALYYKTFDASSTENAWETIAAQSWVTSQIPTDYVTTNSTQTGLTGVKTWMDTHIFNSTVRTNTIGSRESDVRINFYNAGTTVAGGVNMGSLLVSNTFADQTNVPTNGIWSKGDITTAGFLNSVSVNGSTQIGARNTAFTHYDTGTPGHYFYKNVFVEGTIRALGGSTTPLSDAGQIALKGTSGTPYISWHMIDGSRKGYIQATSSVFSINSEGSAFRINSLAGTGTQMIVANANGDLSRQAIPAVGVTSVAAGNGMNFSTITGIGTVTMGTPGTLTASTSNAVTSTSHTHAITTTTAGAANTIVQTNASGVITASGGNSTQWNEAYGWGDYRQWGLGTFTNNTGNVADANTPSETQFFSGTASTTNKPPGTGHTYIHIGRASTIANQLAFDYDNDEVYFRRLRTTWGAWNKFWHDGNLTGAATTIVTSNLTANRALVSNGSGKVAVSAVTSTELGYLDGVTSNVQTQLNGKFNNPSGTTAQYIRGNGTLATFPTIPTVNNGTLTLSTGAGLTGSATFTANQSGNSTFTVGLSAATATVLGGIELFSNTVQSVAANAVTSTASRTYGIQLNSAGQAVVNVPWTNTNTTYSNGNGLTLSGTVFSLTAINAGSGTVGAVRYNGTTRTAGSWYGGTTSPTSTTRLNYDGDLYATNIIASGQVSGFGASDYRLKTEIQEISNPFDILDSINGYSFKWNNLQNIYKGRDYGVIAQEVKTVLPEIVEEVINGVDKKYLGIRNNNALVAVLIQAVKQLKKEVEELRNG